MPIENSLTDKIPTSDARKTTILLAILFLVFLVTVTLGITFMQSQQTKINDLSKKIATATATTNTNAATELQEVVPTETAPGTSPTPSTVEQKQVMMKVKLYYKDVKKDPSVLNCSADTFVYREMPLTQTPLRDVITLLITNQLTAAEKAQGLSGQLVADPTNADEVNRQKQFTLKSASITSGIASLTFNDPANWTSGGSCRVGIMTSQIAETAKQFSTVQSVKLLPELLFQP